MRKSSFTFCLLVTVALASVAWASQEADKKAASDTKKAMTNKMCPVMNSAASEKYRTEYKGQYVYFCCQGCVTMFQKDPATYVAKLSAEDQEAIKANEICPVTKEPIPDQTRWIEHEGRKVYFCCEGCQTMFKQKLAEKKTD
jgi:YHS domain-containing protein